jgi:hypothetical protein
VSNEQDHARVILIGKHLCSTHHIFNANAFPKNVAKKVDSCSTRFALCSLYNDHVQSAVLETRSEFLKRLEAQISGSEHTLQKRTDELRFVAYSDGLRYMAGFFGFVNAAKSSLDIYSSLMGRLISDKVSWSFGKANVDNSKIAGGKVINWLQNCSPKSFAQADDLRELTHRQSVEWITPLVRYRDTLSHYLDIHNFMHMHVPLHKHTPCYHSEEISGPQMPHGESLEEYCLVTLHRLANYVRESIIMFDSVEQNLLSVDKFLNL